MFMFFAALMHVSRLVCVKETDLLIERVLLWRNNDFVTQQYISQFITKSLNLDVKLISLCPLLQGASTSSTEAFGHRAKRARVSGKSHDLPGVLNLCSWARIELASFFIDFFPPFVFW